MEPDELTPAETPEPIIEPVTYVSGLLEAVDDEGWNWRVQLVCAGVSQNGNEYPLSTLHEAAPVYAGVPVFYGRGPDHNRAERGTDAVAGWITEAKPNPRGVEGVYEINRGKPDVRDSIKHAWDVKSRTGRDTIGFSHVIPSGGFVSEARKPNGRKVTKITKAESVDLVMTPAAGGALLAPLSESMSGLPDSGYVFDALQEAIVDVQKLLAQLREGKKKLSLEELSFLQEALSPTEFADALSEAAKAKDAATTQATTPAATQATQEPAINESRVAEIERRMQVAESRSLLTVTLAAAKLPEPLREAIEADFTDRVFESAELDARITRDRDMFAKVAAVKPHGLGAVSVTVTEDQREKHQKAMDGLVWGKRIDGITPFLTLKEAYMAITGDNRYSYISGELPRLIIKEALSYAGDDLLLQESIITTTFGDVLGDSIRRRMLAEYGRPDRQTWRPIVNVVPVVDFRTVERARWGGYGLLPVVPQGAPYQFLTTPGDEKATDSLDKYGGLEDITLETIANDDMGVVRRIPTKLGYAAVDTLYNGIFNTTILNNAVASYDTTALYHNNHGNTGTAALAEAGLLGVENAMRDQTEYGNASGLPLGQANQPRTILIPNELRLTAFKLLQGPNALISAETSTTPNMFQNAYQVIVVDDWTDATDWYAFADPSLSPVLEVGFYQGREEPELFVQDAETVGSMFNADKVTFKVRHIWYIMIVDHRGTYRQVVAG